jgi:hypothetical protein
MAIIGSNNEAGMSSTGRTDSSVQLLMDGLPYTAVSGDEAFRVGLYIGTGFGSDVEISLYDVTSGTASAPLAFSEVIPQANLAPGSWNIQDMASPVALTPGNIYAVGLKINGSLAVSTFTKYLGNGCSTEALTGASNFPALWSDVSTYNQEIGLYVETRTSGGGGGGILPIFLNYFNILLGDSATMKKNTAGQKWTVYAFQGPGGANPGNPVTGDAANITGTLFLDGVSNAIDDTNPTELGGGLYEFDVTQAESNADHISGIAVSSTANVLVVGVPSALYTSGVIDVDANGVVSADSKKINGTTVVGNGTAGNLWRG